MTDTGVEALALAPGQVTQFYHSLPTPGSELPVWPAAWPAVPAALLGTTGWQHSAFSPSDSTGRALTPTPFPDADDAPPPAGQSRQDCYTATETKAKAQLQSNAGSYGAALATINHLLTL